MVRTKKFLMMMFWVLMPRAHTVPKPEQHSIITAMRISYLKKDSVLPVQWQGVIIQAGLKV
jgi:hypothetical protein